MGQWPGFPEVTWKSDARYDTNTFSSKKSLHLFYNWPLKTCFAGPQRTISEMTGPV